MSNQPDSNDHRHICVILLCCFHCSAKSSSLFCFWLTSLKFQRLIACSLATSNTLYVNLITFDTFCCTGPYCTLSWCSKYQLSSSSLLQASLTASGFSGWPAPCPPGSQTRMWRSRSPLKQEYVEQSRTKKSVLCIIPEQLKSPRAIGQGSDSTKVPFQGWQGLT